MTVEERLDALELKAEALRVLLEVYFGVHTQQQFADAISNASMTLAEDP